jgi:hypothetical protein
MQLNRRTIVAIAGLSAVGASGLGPVLATAQSTPTSGDASGGTYTDATGILTVAWPADWTVISKTDVGMELGNPEGTVVLNIAAVAFDGKSWEQVAEADQAWLLDDQGPYKSVTSKVVTPTGYSFATYGQYGLRLVQGVAAEDDLDYYVRVFTGNMGARGKSALMILQQIQAAITINGRVPLQDMDHFIDMQES